MLCTRKGSFTLCRHHGNSEHVKSKASYVGLSLVHGGIAQQTRAVVTPLGTDFPQDWIRTRYMVSVVVC